MPGSFLDTSVLLYVASGDLAKAERAESVIAGGGSINVQVLNELANVARRKMRMPWNDIGVLLSSFRALLLVHPVTIELTRPAS